MDVIHTPTGKVVGIGYDDMADDPRSWDNLGTMVCWHRRYQLGDKHSFATPEDFDEWWKTQDGVILPLYLYDHSGITISTTPFSCPWDSGQVGWIYATVDRIFEEFPPDRVLPWIAKTLTPELYKKVCEVLEAEVTVYDQYLRGDVYYYIIREGDEIIDSCGSIYGPIEHVVDTMPLSKEEKEYVQNALY